MKYNWEEIRLYREAHDGLNALEKLTGEKPNVVMSEKAKEKWDSTHKMQMKFYDLPLEERLYESGVNKRPEKAEK